jgi:hypothetical protein
MATVSKINSSGNYFIAGEIDEYSKVTYYQNLNQYSVATSGGILRYPNSTNFTFSGDFTIEAYLYMISNDGSEHDVAGAWNTGGARSWLFCDINPGNASNRVNFFAISLDGSTGNTQGLTNAAYTFPTGQWVHVAVCRVGTTITAYVNGSVNITGSMTGTNLTASGQIGIGAYTLGGGQGPVFPGYISNFHVVNGTALYTQPFTAFKNPIKAVANTVLLTCQGSFNDNGPLTLSYTSSAASLNSNVPTFTGTIIDYNNGSPTKQYSNGVLEIAGQFDEVSASYFGNQVIAYDFNSNNANLTFFGTTITGSYSSATLAPIANNNGYAAGVLGGVGSAGFGTSGGGGGGIGNGDNGYSSSGAPAIDVSGLFAVATSLGYTSTFGDGGGDRSNGNFPGGGGGGGAGFGAGGPGVGGNAGIAYQYKTANGFISNTIINSSSGAGSFTVPIGTVYVKAWAIGRGRSGGIGDSIGGGGGSGGLAGTVEYCTWDLTQTPYNLSNTYGAGTTLLPNKIKSKLYSNGTIQTFGDFNEFTNGVFSNQTITYDFTGGDALVVFMGATIIGRTGSNGGNSASGGGAGGSYSISQTGQVYWSSNRGGSTGGSGSNGGSGGNGGGGGGGNITDVGGLLAAVTASGQTFTGTNGFGTGARSAFSFRYDIAAYAGGGGPGYSAGSSADPVYGNGGGNGGVVIYYKVWGVDYYQFIGYDSQTSGGFTTPLGTSYVKIWAIGKGGNGGFDGGFSNGGAGGGAGGVAYAEFDSASL